LRFSLVKIGFLGYLSFLVDFLKLVLKEWVEVYVINLVFFILILLMFLGSLIIWFVYPYVTYFFEFEISLLLLIVFLRLKVVFIILLVWFFNSLYVIIRFFRILVQIVSYEVRIFFMFLFFFVCFNIFFFDLLFFIQWFVWFGFYRLVLSYLILLSFICEIYRLPFDLYEGESELVSGINLEFRSFYFMIFFLLEYLDLIFLLLVYVFVFFNSEVCFFMFFLKLLFFMFSMVSMRVIFLRIRYDQVMLIMWIYFLPLVLIFFIFRFFII
jgi:NADH-quinone oxidoreductase subunit H